jgi:hypothetical protein
LYENSMITVRITQFIIFIKLLIDASSS